MKTGLVEMQDFAAGTSSRSTKLVHGGLRYLKQFEVKMVAEVGKERAIVYENGPHVTTPEWMMLPFYKGGNFGPFTSNAGLRVYDLLAGVKKGERRVMLSRTEALQKEPLIKEEELKGAGYYVEYKTDDARLTIEVLKKAVDLGAAALNYAKATEFVYDEDEKLIGVVIEDQITGHTETVYAKKIVNAAGPWVDDLRDMDGSRTDKSLHLTKGVHLVFSQKHFPLGQAIYFDAPDGRMIFAIPRGDKTYVGTTDTEYDGDIAHPIVTKEDRDYLLAAINYEFPTLNAIPEHVESSWAGLRPLIAESGKNPDEISRKDEIFYSDSGLISIAGGKLTGYRKMAEHVVDEVAHQLKKEAQILYSGSHTEHLPISGGVVGGSKQFHQFKLKKIEEGMALGLTADETDLLVQKYGGNTELLFDIIRTHESEAKAADLPITIFAELVYAIKYEMAFKPVDFFIRRTGALFFDITYVKEYKKAVIDHMAKTLNWTQGQKSAFRNELETLVDEAANPK
ncbi:Glycerol-3-phosphate dehydrogenase [Lentibacillus sp. JNUCC-1]|uniref:glycerol-3-phosphate dehydrogenase/oxidase n=1 Tax=Lentibacillus sp. JNUCC-1 TaxID=2654513 RepID=UPI0013228BEF|nr:Glycerol-3-phosphate dehydrogenase [Lentibacillus sp. JNUCC-1]